MSGTTNSKNKTLTSLNSLIDLFNNLGNNNKKVTDGEKKRLEDLLGFLDWTEGHVSQLKKTDDDSMRKTAGAHEISEELTIELTNLQLGEVKVKYVDGWTAGKDRVQTVKNMLDRIRRVMYEHPRRALMHLIYTCAKHATDEVTKKVEELSTTVKSEKSGKLNGIITNELERQLKRIKRNTDAMQRGTVQGSDAVNELENKQDEAEKKKENRARLKQQDIENEVGKAKRVKRRIARFFRSDGMTKKEREAEKQKTAQAEKGVTDQAIVELPAGSESDRTTLKNVGKTIKDGVTYMAKVSDREKFGKKSYTVGKGTCQTTEKALLALKEWAKKVKCRGKLCTSIGGKVQEIPLDSISGKEVMVYWLHRDPNAKNRSGCYKLELEGKYKTINEGSEETKNLRELNKTLKDMGWFLVADLLNKK